MHKLHEKTFQTEFPVFCFRSFHAAGRKWERGQDFPWRELGIPPEKVALLYKTGQIRHRPINDMRALRQIMNTETAPAPAEPVTEFDDLDAIDDMKELRAIADQLGAPYKVSKADQRQAIRDKRAEGV